jgi:hypothetical protein
MKTNVNAFQHRIINESVSNVSELLWFNFFCLVFVLCFKHKFKCFLLFGDTYLQMFVLFLYLTIKKKTFFSLYFSLFFAHLLVNLYCLRCAIFFFSFICTSLNCLIITSYVYCIVFFGRRSRNYCFVGHFFSLFIQPTLSFFI